MTDASTVTQMPARPARRRKGTSTVPAATAPEPLGLALALGGLREAVEGLQQDFQSERLESRASRARLHTRIDDVIEVVHALDKKVDKAGDVARRLTDIEDRRLPDVESEVETLRKTRSAIALVGGGAIKIGIATAGVTAAGAMLWFREGLAALLGRIAGLLL